MRLQIQKIDPTLPDPIYALEDDAGLDLYAREDRLVRSGSREVVPTGIAVAIPRGHAGYIQPRSGMAARHGITVLNSPGLIDSGYRDELQVILINLDETADYQVKRGDRIAQLVIVPIATPELDFVNELPQSSRGKGGFGHTGR